MRFVCIICAGAKTYHLQLLADRGVPWETALAYREKSKKLFENTGIQASGKAGFFIDRVGPVKGQGQSGAFFDQPKSSVHLPESPTY